ncbi:MAG: helicase-associated domain-containing protein [Euzebya sp.]
MSEDGAAEQRRLALIRLGPEGLHHLLRAVPEVALALASDGPLAPSTYGHHHPLGDPPGKLPANLHAVAQALGTRRGISLLLEALDRDGLQLLGLADWHGGVLTVEQVEAEAGEGAAAGLEHAAERLRRLTLATRDDGWLRLLPDARGRVGYHNPRFVDIAGQWTVATLRERLTTLGVSPLPTSKDDLLAVFEQRLRDHQAMQATVSALDHGALEVLQTLLRHGPSYLSAVDIDYWHRSYYRRESAHPQLDALVDRGLVHVWSDEQYATTFQDVAVGLDGRLFDRWTLGSGPSLSDGEAPLHDDPPFVPACTSLLERVLQRWAGDPAPALQSGGIGVTQVRAAAKALGAAEGEVGLLVHLAAQLGLVGSVEIGAPTGRGRNRRVSMGWAPSPLASAWRGLDPAEQWAHLVRQWVIDPKLRDALGLPNRYQVSVPDDPTHLARRAVLRLLLDLSEGTGLEPEPMLRQLYDRSPVHPWSALWDGIIGGLRALGLVPVDGPVGLSTLGRLVLTNPADVAAAVARRGADADGPSLVVQADLTVMAPPETDPAVIAHVDAFADLEASGTVRTYRLTDASIGRGLDAGHTAEEIVAFLTEHAAAGVPQPVRYQIMDVGRRHGQLVAGSMASYLRCEDPGLLARAVALKRAKLELLAPTVAVSGLSRDKLMEALRKAGLMPTVDQADAQGDAGQQGAVGRLGWGRPDRIMPLRAAVSRPDSALARRLSAKPDGSGVMTDEGRWVTDPRDAERLGLL